MRHFYRSCRTNPCGWHRYAYATASAEDRGAQRSARWESRRHRHGRGGNFGARRPLRYLSYQLDLDETQQRAVAAILERLKLDREQAALDEQKTISTMAELVTGEQVSVDGFQQALAPRVESARTLQTAIAKAMQELADVLDGDQREELAHLLRSGAFKI
jgi:hypothetical protein